MSVWNLFMLSDIAWRCFSSCTLYAFRSSVEWVLRQRLSIFLRQVNDALSSAEYQAAEVLFLVGLFDGGRRAIAVNFSFQADTNSSGSMDVKSRSERVWSRIASLSKAWNLRGAAFVVLLDLSALFWGLFCSNI